MIEIACRVRDEVRIGESVRVVVLEVSDDHVRLGITSPHQVPEYQEQVIYLRDAGNENEADGTTEAGRQLVGA
jgi:sRNA-binding carbon storage regulator CsrA